jgi:hypothetical protein
MVSIIDEIVPVDQLKLDGQVHVVSNPRDHWINRVREPNGRDITDLLDAMDNSGINGVVLTNAGDDWLFERYSEKALDLSTDYKLFADENVTQIIGPEEKSYLLVKGQEVFCPEGHYLFWGTKFGENLEENGDNLREIMDSIKDRDEITRIADHPFSFRSGIGSRDNLKDFMGETDALEWNALVRDGYEKFQLGEAGTKYKKPIVSNSDSHVPGNIGNGHIITPGKKLNFSSGYDLMISLRSKVRRGNSKGVLNCQALGKGYIIGP